MKKLLTSERHEIGVHLQRAGLKVGQAGDVLRLIEAVLASGLEITSLVDKILAQYFPPPPPPPPAPDQPTS